MAVLFSASLILSNVAYVHLSVSFVQMLKVRDCSSMCAKPRRSSQFSYSSFNWCQDCNVRVPGGRVALTTPAYNHLLMCVICLTCAGCFIAASGEVRFSVFGLVCQTSAVIVSGRGRCAADRQVESMRLVLIQVLLKEYKMDPLTSIAMYAPVSRTRARARLTIRSVSSLSA